MNHTAQELFNLLNEQDECPWIEAKGGSESTHSIMETVCAYSNEPGLGGGYILLGVAEDNTTLFHQYKTVGVNDLDKFQRDFSTQCADMFNSPVRPKLEIETVNKHSVIKVWVDELPASQKPLYFKSDRLPKGAFRRIGSTDQRCTEDDLRVFYHDYNTYDQTPVKGATIKDIDENAIKRYRALREKVNPEAEELTFSDAELLQSLGCVNKENPNELNIAGLLLFGTNKLHRSTFPMWRVDYIRVPGNKWVEDPDNRFTTIDMRGSLILMLYRLIDAINTDLPKGFLLPDNTVQAEATGLPLKALREAIVNALMHRSYREHRPTQIIRYNNRIEIINPGFSLKSEENLGQPGSETRNPFIAAIFHETNLAETKGSGIRAMRRLMQDAHLVPPTFESSRENNEFVSRLLLHNFLDEKDLIWLQRFEKLKLNDSQKQALIFIREVGAIDNHTYRQMADCDTMKASQDLRDLKTHNLLSSKGKGKSTYYVPSELLSLLSLETIPAPWEKPDSSLNSYLGQISSVHQNTGILNPFYGLSTPPLGLSTPPPSVSTPPLNPSTPPSIPINLLEEVKGLKKRENDPEKIRSLIKRLCEIKPIKTTEMASIFGKSEDYLKKKFLGPMISSKELKYMHPEMVNHPEQAYLTNKND